MQISIRKNKEDKVLNFVTLAISLFEPNSTTLAVENAHEFEQYVYALSNLFERKGITSDDAQSIIRSVIKKSKDYSPLTLDNFKNCLKEARRESLGGPHERYYFVFSLKIKFNSMKKRHFIVLDTKIKVRSYKYIQKNFSYGELKQKAEHDTRIEEGLEHSRTYFVIEESAIDKYKAVQSVYGKFELLRSIIDFVDQYGKHRVPNHSFGNPKPLSLIYPPKVFFAFDSNRTYLDMWMTDITYDPKEIDFDSPLLTSNKVIEKSEKRIKKVNSLKKGGLRDLIIEAFYLHNNALDYYDKKWLSFLSFWQIFELITLSRNYTLKQDDVCKRMLSLFGKGH